MPIFRSDRLRSFASKESLARFATEVTLPTTPIRRVVAVLVDTVHACAVHTHNTTSGNLIIIAMIDVSVSACQQVAVVVCPNPHTTPIPPGDRQRGRSVIPTPEVFRAKVLAVI